MKRKKQSAPDELAAQDEALSRVVDENGPYDSFNDLVKELERPEYDRYVRNEPSGDSTAIHRHWTPRATQAHQLKYLIKRYHLPWLEDVRQIHKVHPSLKRHGVAKIVSERLTKDGHPVSYKTIERWIDALGGLARICNPWV
jgi:hypothetical protein